MRPYTRILLLGILATLANSMFAIGGCEYVSFTSEPNAFALSVPERPTTILVGNMDFPGVVRAAGDLCSDLTKVTGRKSVLLQGKAVKGTVVLIGTLGKSELIDGLAAKGKLDAGALRGKWEQFLLQVVDKPLPGVEKALVIAGSDKRGTIFGIYDLCQKIGVSPWYWWADVPVRHQDRVYVRNGTYSEGPSVKYRGIFINDEAPALSGWIHATYGDVTPSENPPIRKGVANYGRAFYTKVFELLLRLKANYLWPAMWGNAFNEDDPENARLADEYGIVMGTSHQEPMLRSQQEWDRRYARTLGQWDYTKHPDVMQEFWRQGIRRNKDFESIVTMGLRGANDTEMKGSMQENISMVEGILQTQRSILRSELGKPLDEIPQTWCLYKEINEYYNQGMKVPEDITLLWSDDNWGYIRRLPTAEERLRKGGAGVYYHFDYHGGPRSYEWINTNPLPKIWEQLSMAKQYGADRIWIVNIGHFRGYELPTEYFMDLAWNTSRWTNDNTVAYTRSWAAREFGATYANDIASILSGYGKFNARRKPESLTPNTYSLTNFDEAERVVADYQALSDKADRIAAQLPASDKDAYYHLVKFPANIGAIVNELYLSAGKNQLYARQGRVSANEQAKRALELFRRDTALMTHYNTVYAGGRWNHFMDQTHLGYVSWNPPRKNSLIAPMFNVNYTDTALLGVALEGRTEAWPASAEPATLPEFDPFSGKAHWLEVFNRGGKPFQATLHTNQPWIHLSETRVDIASTDKRIWLRLNEELLPEGLSTAVVTVEGAGLKVDVQIQARKPVQSEAANLKGFIQSNGLISIEPEHFDRNTPVDDKQWLRVEDYGLNLSGMRATSTGLYPAPAEPGVNAPCLEYPIHLFTGDSIQVNLITAPLLNVMPDRDLKVAVSLDNDVPRYLVSIPGNFSVQTSRSWGEGVLNQCRRLTTTVTVKRPGAHTLKVWMIDPGVVVQKIVLNAGKYPVSYLGPPESVRK
jgi:hypothetical protein